MNAVGIIPARMGASRFPGKPLALIAGKPMLEHVVAGARAAKRLREVIVATDDARIASACAAFGARAVMTSPAHPTGTDRIAEVAAALDAEIVVNVQGDEPLIAGFVIDAVIDALAAAPECAMATAVHRMEPDAASDLNRVKAVLDRAGNALYFSRSAIPFRRAPLAAALRASLAHSTALASADSGSLRASLAHSTSLASADSGSLRASLATSAERFEEPPLWQHVGLYAYRRGFLLDYVRLPQTPLERAEQLEQLRALEHGHKIRCALIEGWRSVPVDTPADISRVEAALAARGARA